MDNSSVRVALRIRPQLAKEKIEGCRICTYVAPGEPQVTLGKDKSFTYDYVFDTPTEQNAVYDSCVKPLVEGCFEGYNATVFAYGQTGSGKTYTMGTGFDVTTLPEQLGVVPRAMGHLFRGINKRKEEAKQAGLPLPEFSIAVQFLELYNEELVDLFDADSRGRPNLRIHEDSNGSIYVHGASFREVASAEATLKSLHDGALNRTTAATQMNAQSSRSHAIFSVTIKQTRAVKPGDQVNGSSEADVASNSDQSETSSAEKPTLEFESLSAKFHFTDLAGSERLRRTGATGMRAKEGIAINLGLLTLGNVINALGDPEKKSLHVPYRDSKLTRLLQDSLGGNSRTLMVACISPSDSDFMETLNTLKYANRARNIKNKVVANQDTASKQIQVLRQQLAALQLELTEYKTGKRIVGEDGVEAYNDMFLENSILQKENNNYRMKLKAMQETVDSYKERIVTITCEMNQVKLQGASGEGVSPDVASIVENYVKEIEELRSKLVESEALCSTLRRRSEGLTSYAIHRSPTPISSMSGSIDFEATTHSLTNGKSVLEIAKEEIDKLATKKETLRQKHSSGEKKPVFDDGESIPDMVNGSGNISEQAASEDGQSASEASEVENDTGVSSSDEDDDDETSDICGESSQANHQKDAETLQKEFASITHEIDIKLQLVNELESMQRRIASMQRHYEEKLKLMADTIRATEVERDKVLKNLDSKSSGNSEKSKKIKADYERQLDKMKKEMGKLQDAKRSHDRLVREQSKHANQLKSLRFELEQMKKTKIRLMRQMKEEQKKSKNQENKRLRELMKLKRDFKVKENEVRNLTSKNRQKDLMMKRKQEEVSILRKQLKPISGRFGKKKIINQLKQDENPRSQDTTFVVEKGGGGGEEKGGSRKRPRKHSSEFSSRAARLKLKSIQAKIDEAVVQRETISNIDRQMERLLKERERLQREMERLHRKQSKAKANNEDSATRQRLKEEGESLQENIEFVNEQIQECQMEIMQVEEALEDTGVLSSIIQYCSTNEARYMLENLIRTTISKAAIEVQTQTRLKDVQSRLEVSEESAKQAHDLMRYILQERPNLDRSIAECLSEYMKGTASDSGSSRESSPDRDDVTFQDATKVMFSTPNFESPDLESLPKPLSKEVKARRRTATPQELLHGMPSPIASNLSPLLSLDEERTFVIASADSGVPRDFSTPDCSGAVDRTVIEVKVTTNEEDNAKVVENINPLSLPDSYAKDDSVISRPVNHPAAAKSNSSPISLPNPTPSETPPGSPISSRSKAAVNSNVFSRLTTYALSSPRNDKGRMNPYTSKTVPPRSSPLICTHIAEGHHKPVLCVEATDQLLFTGSKDRTVKVWNLVTCQEMMSLDGHPNNVNVVRYCQSSGLIYTVSLCYIKVWDIRNHAKCVRILSSSGGHQLASNFTGSISRTNRMPDNESTINDIRLRDGGKMLLCASATNVKIWDLNKFSVIGKLTGHTGNVMTMAVPEKTGYVITGSKDHLIKVYDVSMGVQGNVIPSVSLTPPHMDGVESLAYSTTSNVLFSSSRDKSIKKWDMTKKTVIKSEYQAHASWVCALDIIQSDDGDEMLVSGGRHGVVKMWDVHSFGSIGSVPAHSDAVNDISSNNTHLFTASSDRTVCMWRLASMAKSYVDF